MTPRRWVITAVFLVVLNALAFPAAAQVLAHKKAPVSAGPLQEQSVDLRLLSHLDARADAKRQDDPARAELALALYEELHEQLGTVDSILAASLLLREARAEREAERAGVASELVGRAVRIAPRFVSAHLEQLSLLWENEPGRIGGMFEVIRSAVSAVGGSLRNQICLSTVFLYAVSYAIVLVLFIWSAACAIRCFRYLIYDLSRPVTNLLGSPELFGILVVLLCWPLAFGLSFLAPALVAVGITLPYQRFSERCTSVVVLLATLSLGLVVDATTPLVRFHGSRLDHLTKIQEEAVSQSEQLDMDSAAQLSADPLALKILAESSYRRNLDDDAIRYLEMLQKEHGKTRDSLNNLGVVQYRKGQHDVAESLLSEASGLGRGSAIVGINQSLVLGGRGDFEGAQAARLRAKELNSSMVDTAIDRTAGLPTNRRLLWARVSHSAMWKSLYRHLEDDESLSRTLKVRAFGASSAKWGILPWIVVGLAGGGLGLRRHRSIPCVRCGTPTESNSPERHCSQCQSIFIASISVAPDLKAKKERQIRHWQSLLEWAPKLGAVIPGFGFFMSGRPLLGFPIVVLFSLLVGILSASSLTRFHAWYLEGFPTGEYVLNLSAWIGLGILTLLSLALTLLRRRDVPLWR